MTSRLIEKKLRDFGVEVRVVIRDGDKHALPARKMSRRNQAMGIELADQGDRRMPHQPARRASTRRLTTCSAGSPPRIMYVRGACPAKMTFRFGRCTHSSASLSEYRIRRPL